MNAYVCVLCVCMYMYICTYVCMYVCKCIYIYIYICICIYIYAHRYVLRPYTYSIIKRKFITSLCTKNDSRKTCARPMAFDKKPVTYVLFQKSAVFCGVLCCQSVAHAAEVHVFCVSLCMLMYIHMCHMRLCVCVNYIHMCMYLCASTSTDTYVVFVYMHDVPPYVQQNIHIMQYIDTNHPLWQLSALAKHPKCI